MGTNHIGTFTKTKALKCSLLINEGENISAYEAGGKSEGEMKKVPHDGKGTLKDA